MVIWTSGSAEPSRRTHAPARAARSARVLGACALASSVACVAFGVVPIPAGAAPRSPSATRGAAAAGSPARARAAATLTSSSGEEASYALGTGEDFSWILPLENEANYEVWDGDVENGSWMPLYFAGKGSKTGIDYTLSIAKKPVYSDGDTTVTITLNTDFTWSDGQKVTATDVKFFFELDEAGKATLGDYLPGELPDDVASISYPGPDTVVLHLNHAYNPTWFTGNQLGWIYPLPAQTWDKTCATCPAGSAAATPSGAAQVFKFLYSQSEDLATYASNPLWKTVDGPWVISTYDETTYDASFVANAHYTGPTKPKLAGYKLYSFTTGTAEVDALRSGTITFGWLPLSDYSEASYFSGHGFTVKPWKFFYNEVVELGYTSKTWGPIMKQLYVRQALQHLITEQLYISRTLHGYGTADYGVVADYPGSRDVSPALRTDPYPFDPNAAKALLSAHGWKAGAGGVDVCRRAGTGPHDCGAGIRKGKALSFPFMYATGTTAFLAQVSSFASTAKKIGIDITLDGQTEDTMFSIAGVCPSAPPCKWGLAAYSGYMWPYGQYHLLPTGDNQFGKGNFWAGGYTTAKAQRLIAAADGKPGIKVLYADEDYLQKQEASLWWPVEDVIVVARNRLKGWQQLSPYGTIVPQLWSVSG